MSSVLSAVLIFVLAVSIAAIPFEEFEPAWKNHLKKHGLGRMNFSRGMSMAFLAFDIFIFHVLQIKKGALKDFTKILSHFEEIPFFQFKSIKC